MKDKIITFIFIGYISLFSILHLLIPDLKISKTERRKLDDFPKVEINNKYITKIESYLLDHFPFRSEFRKVKAIYNYKILNKLDNNDYSFYNNNIYKSDYPTNIKSINNFEKHIQKMKLLFNKNNNVYMMIIPDKNYYLEEDNFLHIDYNYIYNCINKINRNNIDIRTTLNSNDYYQTDTHWKQENLAKVIKKMSDEMNFSYTNINYKENKYNNFYGVYYSEDINFRKPEVITYLTNEIIDNAEVTYLENKNLNKVYNLSKLDSLDSYEVYLDGASAYIEINNNLSKSTKELIIFRDSFTSSLAPLLINYYSKITLIDNRYISCDNFKNLIEFTNQDILFAYSTSLINNSMSLKN